MGVFQRQLEPKEVTMKLLIFALVFALMVFASNSAPTNELRVQRSAEPQNPLGLLVPPRRLRPRPRQPIRNLVNNTVAFYSQTSSFSRPLSLSLAHTRSHTHGVRR